MFDTRVGYGAPGCLCIQTEPGHVRKKTDVALSDADNHGAISQCHVKSLSFGRNPNLD
jgi:hypothetical protein